MKKYEGLFKMLFSAKTEKDVTEIIEKNTELNEPLNWHPIGGNESNFSIIENQQSNPIAALVEKVTNSMDAILMRKCIELEIDPKSQNAPKSMEDAISTFYKDDYKSWDLATFRKRQAEEIQIIADGPTKESAVIIYDNGEGQHPEKFEDTFLSLMKGNKNEIHFVQGKYNMGGSGAIVFCGKKGYQLIASRRYDASGKFGWTLTREHPFTSEESNTKKNTWYEYLKIDGQIPAFDIDELGLNLLNRRFKTGSIIKLYSYHMKGIYGFAQDLAQSFNEFMFKPVLPLYCIDTKERYPKNKVLEATVFGLQRRLEEENDYVEDYFSEIYEDSLFGKMKVTCYLFKTKQSNKSVKETKEDISTRFFKNNMSVLFSMNGQVHGHYTSEFITRGLKFNLLKDYLLIDVDCTKMNYSFRRELFMASRDRLKQGDETNELREYLKKKLVKSKLDEHNKKRKESIGLESEDTDELIKNFAKNLPKDSDLFKLLQNTLKLEDKKKEIKKEPSPSKPANEKQEKPFKPERFPTFFKLFNNPDKNKPINVPIGGEKTLKFETDVEDHYFDRSEEPGDLEISVLNVKRNDVKGGDKPGEGKDITDLINIVKSSPNKGTIKITVNPNTELRTGDEIEIKASLIGPGITSHDEVLMIKIVDLDGRIEKVPELPQDDFDNMGLPQMVKVNKEQWEQLESNGGMDYSNVMVPQSAGETLEKIYINLDSTVFLNHRKKLKSEDQISTALKKYVSTVYFHTIFLYMITKRKKYSITLESENNHQDITIDDYVKDVFDSYYADFLLNFGMEELMGAIGE
jgi:hypothetical protein